MLYIPFRNESLGKSTLNPLLLHFRKDRIEIVRESFEDNLHKPMANVDHETLRSSKIDCRSYGNGPLLGPLEPYMPLNPFHDM